LSAGPFSVILSTYTPFRFTGKPSLSAKSDVKVAPVYLILSRQGPLHVPDRRIMDLRELVRHRIALVRMRTNLKNKIHSIVLMKSIQTCSKHCSFTHLYNEELKELDDYRINGYLHLIESLDSEIKDVYIIEKII
jgi:hypothetical protein